MDSVTDLKDGCGQLCTSASSVAEEMISLRSCRFRITWYVRKCGQSHTKTHTWTDGQTDKLDAGKITDLLEQPSQHVSAQGPLMSFIQHQHTA